MESRGLRYFIGFVIVIGLLIFLFVLIFGGGDSKTKVPTSSRTLYSYADTDSKASLTIAGQVNATSLHREITITVDANHVLYQEIHGYNGDIANTKSYGNTKSSYESFLRALEHAGFTKGDTAHMNADDRGYCSLGTRYIFKLEDQGKTVERFWATSCGKPKTFLGELGLNIDLFRHQVPDYEKLVNNISL